MSTKDEVDIKLTTDNLKPSKVRSMIVIMTMDDGTTHNLSPEHGEIEDMELDIRRPVLSKVDPLSPYVQRSAGPDISLHLYVKWKVK
jgi:hypothetical protein